MNSEIFFGRTVRPYKKFKRALQVRAREMGVSSSVGNASSFLYGIQAKKGFF